MQQPNTHISYRNTPVPFFYHEYNCGFSHDFRTTERSLEIALADAWLNSINNDAIELGAVTPYYFPGRIGTIVDPFDSHSQVTNKESLFNVSFSGRNILCLSTLEHIGTNDYHGISTHESAVSALNRILHHAKKSFITIPSGYNANLDAYIFSSRFGKTITVTYYMRGPLGNDWKTTTNTNLMQRIPYGPLSANGLICIEKE